MEPTTTVSMASGCGHEQAIAGDPDRLLTIGEVADWLGVSVSTLYQRSSRREGPNRLKIGTALRYKRCCVAAWIDEHMVTPLSTGTGGDLRGKCDASRSEG